MKIHLDSPAVTVVNWFGVPYYVENSFNGRFITILDVYDTEVTADLFEKILKKYELLKKNAVWQAENLL